jgi:hypothetical protein
MTEANRSQDPRVGPVGCKVLGGAFLGLGLFQLAIAQIVPQGGELSQVLCIVLPVLAITAAITAIVTTSRLSLAHRTLWVSAASAAAWFAVSYVTSLGE